MLSQFPTRAIIKNSPLSLSNVLFTETSLYTKDYNCIRAHKRKIALNNYKLSLCYFQRNFTRSVLHQQWQYFWKFSFISVLVPISSKLFMPSSEVLRKIGKAIFKRNNYIYNTLCVCMYRFYIGHFISALLLIGAFPSRKKNKRRDFLFCMNKQKNTLNAHKWFQNVFISDEKFTCFKLAGCDDTAAVMANKSSQTI